MFGVLDVGGEDFQAINLRRQGRCDGPHRRIIAFGDPLCRPGGVGVDHGFQLQAAQRSPALAQRLDVAMYFLQCFQRGAFRRHQLMIDPQEMLANDVQGGMGQQLVNVRHPAGHRVFDRDHAKPRRAVFHRLQQILEGGAGQRLHLRVDLPAGEVRIRPRLTLESYAVVAVGRHGPSSWLI